MNASHDLLRRPTTLLLSLVLVVPMARPKPSRLRPRVRPRPQPLLRRPTPCRRPIKPRAPAMSRRPSCCLPFEVNSTKDQGYYTQNTLAGTRLNNNIADLGSSITVVTRQSLRTRTRSTSTTSSGTRPTRRARTPTRRRCSCAQTSRIRLAEPAARPGTSRARLIPGSAIPRIDRCNHRGPPLRPRTKCKSWFRPAGSDSGHRRSTRSGARRASTWFQG